MRPIDPHLFTRLMRLPPKSRMDLLEFVGATPIADLQLEQLIDMMSSPPFPNATGEVNRPLRPESLPQVGVARGTPVPTLS